MKTKILSALIALMAFSTAFAIETFDARILVTDFDEVPVTQMEVLLFNADGKLIHSGNTGAEGSFSLTLSAGKYRIQLKEGEVIKKEADLNIPELEGRKMYNLVRIQVLYEPRDKFEIENLNFETGSPDIMPSSYEILDRLATYLKSESENKFEVSGHTDSDGSEKSNADLSLARAESVMTYLIEKGVTAEQLVAKGYGESNPIADNSSEEGKAQNRRTEMKKIEE
ncbi:MAG: OOP family OmpA-OmpF porin [Arenicella sp.]|jgi:OOP family OmpA-OmpF porin